MMENAFDKILEWGKDDTNNVCCFIRAFLECCERNLIFG